MRRPDRHPAPPRRRGGPVLGRTPLALTGTALLSLVGAGFVPGAFISGMFITDGAMAAETQPAAASQAIAPQVLAADAAMLDREAQQMAVLAALTRIARTPDSAGSQSGAAPDRLRAGLLLSASLPLIQADLVARRNSVLAEDARRPAPVAAPPMPAVAQTQAQAQAQTQAQTQTPAPAIAKDAARELAAALQAKRRTAGARAHAQAALASAETDLRRAHRQAAGGDVGRLIGALGRERRAEAHRRDAAARLRLATVADERQAHLLADLQQASAKPVQVAQVVPVPVSIPASVPTPQPVAAPTQAAMVAQSPSPAAPSPTAPSPAAPSPAAPNPAKSAEAAPPAEKTAPGQAAAPVAPLASHADVLADGAGVRLPPFIPGETGAIGVDALAPPPVQMASAATDSGRPDGSRTRAEAPAVESPATESSTPDSSAASPAPQPGQLLAPVSGRIVKRYGAENGYDTEQGLTLAAQPGSRVIAPFGGKIEFAGPFKGYGQILIIDHGGGYHSLVAGMDHVNGAVGQIVTTGEAIGSMGAGNAAPNLYLELRHQGEPINPLPWLAAHDGKVSG